MATNQDHALGQNDNNMQASPPHGTHTQFLDLTNGEGGERHDASSGVEMEYTVANPSEVEAATNDNDAEYPQSHQHNNEDVGDGQGDAIAMAPGDSSMMSASSVDGSPTQQAVNSSRSRSIPIDPNTPGKVVETGQEHTGRWTREEHEAFLSALKMYGKEWKKVAAKVKTRTVVQTRTHAQKYFQKLQKTIKGGGSVGGEEYPDVDMGPGTEAKKPATVSVAASSNVPQVTLFSPEASSPPDPQPQAKKKKLVIAPKSNRRTSTATMSAAEVISTLSDPQHSAGGFVAAASSSNMILGGPSPPPPRHGFSTDIPETESLFTSSYVKKEWPIGGSGGFGNGVGRGLPSMKIVAPDPSATMARGKFPEPSPAATGKRKLAEIAAARMLAGVAGVSVQPQIMSTGQYGDDGPPTPPPGPPTTRSFNLKDAPLPPFVGAGRSSSLSTFQKTIPSSHKGMSLQIVNPESLGVTYEPRRHRTGDGENSPVTPWDGQLEALMSENVDYEDEGKAEEKEENSNDKKTGEATGTSDGQTNRNITSQGFSLHAICDPSKSHGRSALHQAVCEKNVEALQMQIHEDSINSSNDTGESLLQRKDKLGFYPLHSACALALAVNYSEGTASAEDTNSGAGKATPNDVVRILISAGADPYITDSKGNTPLHWAARAGDKAVTEQLLMKSCPLDARNQQGETPLHMAMRSGIRAKDVVAVLLDNGARPGILDKNFQRPLDVTCQGFLDEEGSIASLKAREGNSQQSGKKMSKELKKALKMASEDLKEMRAFLLIRSAQSRTMVLHHPECLEHHAKSASDWEAPDRVKTIMKRVLPSTDSTGATETSGIFPHEVAVSKDFDRASLELLSRVHSTEYLSFVNKLSKDLEKKLKLTGSSGGSLDESSSETPPQIVPFTPMVQRTMIKIEESQVKLHDNSDTSFSAGSLRAARRAAGAVQHAVDCVLVGRNRNAFCVVRPPGHHAGVNGLLEGGESCGFCIFNNVAAGALYAIQEDRLLCERCAIVDIDVHHGNGTEEIVRKCHDPSKLFFFSIHLYDNDKRKRNPNQFVYKFYPGTGLEDDLAMNIINVPIVPLWKESAPAAQPVKTHNTRHKARNTQDKPHDDASETSDQKLSSRASDVPSESGSNNVSSPRPTGTSSGRLAYREAIRNRLLPALRAFNPDLILISAGFDAAKGDVGNARHERGGRERMGLDLEPEDYAWTTRKVLEIADICCQGRVVSVLEGGYGRTPRKPAGTEDEIHALDRTMLGECAVRHLHALIDPYDAEKRFS